MSYGSSTPGGSVDFDSRSSRSRGEGSGRQMQSPRAMDPEFARNEDALIDRVLSPSLEQSLLNRLTGGMMGVWGVTSAPGLVDRPGGGAPVPGLQYSVDPMDSKLAGVMSGAIGGVGLKALAKALGASGKTNMAAFGVPGAEIGTKPVAPSAGNQGQGQNPGSNIDLLMKLLGQYNGRF